MLLLYYEKPWIYFELWKALKHVLSLFRTRDSKSHKHYAFRSKKKHEIVLAFRARSVQNYAYISPWIDCGTTAIFVPALQNKIKMFYLESSKVKNMFFSIQFSLPFPWPSKNPIIKRTESGSHASGNVQIVYICIPTEPKDRIPPFPPMLGQN